MRLTLRTLLGYLDDILGPQQAREIGEKINESAYASSLVARIKDVLRRRRITAPEVVGPGSDPDPNTVSEYLDNTLSQERVEDLERVCLGSDVHLAEVAACHQILTLVLGEPVDIPQELRERTYALGALSRSDNNGRDRGEPGTAAAAAGEAAATSTESALPEYLRQEQSSSFWRKVLPVAALLLVATVWIGLIISDPSHSWRPDRSIAGGPQNGEAANPESEIIPPAVPPVDPTAGTATPTAPAPEPGTAPMAAAVSPEGADAATPAPAMTAPPAVASINPPPPADLPEPATPAATPAPSADPAAKPAPREESPMPVASSRESKPVAEDPHRILYNSNEGVLLQAADDGEWRVLPRRSLVHPGDGIASPHPFESLLQIDETGATVTLMGGTRVSLIAPQAAPLSLRIEEARIVFRRPAVGGTDVPLTVELHLGDRSATLQLLEAGTEVGLEVTPRMAEGLIDPPLPPTWDGALTVVSGAARLTTAQGPVALSSGQYLSLMEGDFSASPQASRGMPQWMVPLSGAVLAVSRNYAQQFEKEFQLDRNVSESIPAMIENRQMRLSQLAVQALALTGGDRALVRALAAPHQESRQAAIVGLGVRLRSDPANSLRIREEVQRAFPENIAGIIEQLLWGYPPSAAYNPDLSRELVSWLMHDLIAIRELAFFQILRLTGNQETNRYQPDAPETQRRVTTGYWENWIRKNGALREAPAEPAPPVVPPPPAPGITPAAPAPGITPPPAPGITPQ